MDKKDVVAGIKKVGLIPILRAPSADDALEIAELLFEAGITTQEIPLTVPGGVEVIAELVQKFGDHALIGAGTVLDPAAAESCLRAGARFIISPGLNLNTVRFCNEAGVAIFPGALTPTEILTAWRGGADMVKVFPASAVGGAAYIKAVKAPLAEIDLCPTGGVSLQTAAAFIQAGASALGVGGDLVDVEALRAGRGQVIAERARQYLDIVAQARA